MWRISGQKYGAEQNKIVVPIRTDLWTTDSGKLKLYRSEKRISKFMILFFFSPGRSKQICTLQFSRYVNKTGIWTPKALLRLTSWYLYTRWNDTTCRNSKTDRLFSFSLFFYRSNLPTDMIRAWQQHRKMTCLETDQVSRKSDLHLAFLVSWRMSSCQCYSRT